MFTPGLWRVEHYDIEENPANGIRVYAGPSKWVADVGSDGDEREANARLIAAAPGLLARLEQAIKYLEHPSVVAMGFAIGSDVCAKLCREEIDKARAGE